MYMKPMCSGPNLVMGIFLTYTSYHRSHTYVPKVASWTGVVGGLTMKAFVVLLGLITVTLLLGNWGAREEVRESWD